MRPGQIELLLLADGKLTAHEKLVASLFLSIWFPRQERVSASSHKTGVAAVGAYRRYIMNRSLFAAAASFAALFAASAIAAPPKAKPLSAQTRANLEAAMHGEAYANLKYLRYADQAEAAGKPALAKLFRASANIEANEHFDREAQALQLGGANSANLEDAMAGEHYENVTMYVNFAKQAEADGDVKVAAMFRQIAVDEGTHYDAYKAALAKLPPR